MTSTAGVYRKKKKKRIEYSAKKVLSAAHAIQRRGPNVLAKSSRSDDSSPRLGYIPIYIQCELQKGARNSALCSLCLAGAESKEKAAKESRARKRDKAIRYRSYMRRRADSRGFRVEINVQATSRQRENAELFGRRFVATSLVFDATAHAYRCRVTCCLLVSGIFLFVYKRSSWRLFFFWLSLNG